MKLIARDEVPAAAHAPVSYRDILREAYGERELDSWIATNRHADDALVTRKLASMSRKVQGYPTTACQHAEPAAPRQHPTPDAVANQLVELATHGRIRDAHQLLAELLDAGWTLRTMISKVLPSVQRSVGAMWQAGQVSVAQEHVATGVVDELLGALGRLIPAPTSGASVAVICPEGERHTAPARLASLLLRLDGWPTTLLGTAVPGDDLTELLSAERPSFIAVSCTYPLALAGATQVAQVARSLGIPTIAGGAAFGNSPHRAERLGMDGWAASPAEASRCLRAWSELPPTRPLEARGASVRPRVDARWDSIVEQSIAQLLNASLLVRHGEEERQLELVREQLLSLLRASEQAALCDDASIFTDHVDWLRSVHPAAGLPHQAVGPAITILRDLTAALGPQMQRILLTRSALLPCPTPQELTRRA